MNDEIVVSILCITYNHEKFIRDALEGFVNAKVLIRALEEAGRNLTREKFIEAFESMHNVDIGIGKTITYSILDHQGLSGIYYSRLEGDGIFRIFKQNINTRFTCDNV